MTLDPAYFSRLSRALGDAFCHRPTLVLDRPALLRNVGRIREALAGGPALRIVDKSLPVPDLLNDLMAMTGSRRMMSFHLPVTLALIDRCPDSHVLFGKPMPSPAVAAAINGPKGEALIARTTFLADTLDRLGELHAIADSAGRTLSVALEINVGLNRGGFADPAAMAPALGFLRGQTALKLDGLMGYEAHIPAIPKLFGGYNKAHNASEVRFRAFSEALRPDEKSILNTGGSKTATSYRAPHPANDVSIGSAFVMPTDFDGGLNRENEPALFIATPILKEGPALLPGLDRLTPLFQALRLFPRRGVFTYGGKWMARPVWPASLKASSLWGESSNQQFFGIGPDETVTPGDMAFFRPTQSEAVMSQFGPIAVYDGSAISSFLEPLPPG